jgi:hypothetical protein
MANIDDDLMHRKRYAVNTNAPAEISEYINPAIHLLDLPIWLLTSLSLPYR